MNLKFSTARIRDVSRRTLRPILSSRVIYNIMSACARARVVLMRVYLWRPRSRSDTEYIFIPHNSYISLQLCVYGICIYYVEKKNTALGSQRAPKRFYCLQCTNGGGGGGGEASSFKHKNVSLPPGDPEDPSIVVVII